VTGVARFVAALPVFVAVVGLGACTRDDSGGPGGATGAASVPVVSPAAAAGPVDAGVTGGPSDTGGRVGGNGGVGVGAGGRAKRNAPPFVFVDGKPWAALQKTELPPGLKPVVDGGADAGEAARRYSLAGYLRAAGIDVKAVRAVHLHGGRNRVGILTGAQLLEPPDTQFSFTREAEGRVVMRWAPDARTTDMIHKVVNVAVYVHKPPPIRDPHTGALSVDGVAIDGPAYVTADVQGGTRAYVDGRLVGILRPRDLEGEGPFPLVAQLARLGGVVDAIVAVDLIHEDVIIRRVPSRDVAALAFTVPPGAGGVSAFGADPVSVVRAWRTKAPERPR
jgi:hypothetical protein